MLRAGVAKFRQCPELQKATALSLSEHSQTWPGIKHVQKTQGPCQRESCSRSGAGMRGDFRNQGGRTVDPECHAPRKRSQAQYCPTAAAGEARGHTGTP